MKKLKLLSLAALFAATVAHPATWVKTFGGADIDWGSCVQQTSDGGYIVSGFTYSFSTIPGKAEIWLLKLDSLGDTDWTKTYGEGGGYSVRQTLDGGYVICGTKLIRTDVNGDTIWARPYEADCVQVTDDDGYILAGLKSDAAWLFELDENGDSLWEHVYPKIGGDGDRASWVEQTSDGGYIVTGFSLYTQEEDHRQRASVFLMKTDADGVLSWTKSYGGEEWDILDRGHCVRQTSDGGYVIAGPVHIDGLVVNLLKTDASGNVEWKSIRGAHECYCVEELVEGGFIVAGATEWATSALSLSNGNVWLIKTDENGDTVWTREYGGGGTDAGRYVQKTTDDGYIVIGYTTSFGAGDYDLYLLKTDSLGLLSIVEKPPLDNPLDWFIVSSVGREVVLRYSNCSKGFEVKVFDAAGRQVSELQNNFSSGTISWGLNYPPGVYFIRVNEPNKASTARIVLVR